MYESPNIDTAIDNIFDLFDRAMYTKDESGMTFGLKLAESIIWELDTDIIVAILSITLPVKLSLEARAEFGKVALETITKREPENFFAILQGLI